MGYCGDRLLLLHLIANIYIDLEYNECQGTSKYRMCTSIA